MAQLKQPRTRAVQEPKTSRPAVGSAAGAVQEQLLRRIRAGEFAPHGRLPGERELAAEYGVSRVTLRRALDELERMSLVSRVPGRGGGTFTRQPKVERDLSHLASVPAYLRKQGFAAGTRVLSARIQSATGATAAALRLPDDGFVYEIVRLRLADGVPISIEHAHLTADRFPGLLEQPLGGSIYQVLQKVYGFTPSRALERLEPVAAGPEEAHALGVAAGAPLLAVERICYGPDDVPFEHSNDLFRGDRTSVVVPIPHYEPPAESLLGDIEPSRLGGQ